MDEAQKTNTNEGREVRGGGASPVINPTCHHEMCTNNK